MKKASSKPSRTGRTARRRKVLLSRRTKIRRIGKGASLKGRKKRAVRPLRSRLRKRGARLVKKKRLRRKDTLPAAALQLVPAEAQAPTEQVVVPLPAEPGVPPETPPPDAYQQGYNEAYDVGFDTGFAKGFEDGHKLEFS
ncbi:hypothetical protein G5B47_14805 [Paenibacillus sp. 7124]|uniref:Uncharacterized protein n=1 Tax=Paenibacillus apii TaxID=1850370 RepID=A0A6M1PJT0_9BACL|nr:hypothetical protein [Paenibacillus apii]NGM83689.1 hypothetical protein [Paenibacillus apii]NJJ41206.1 hypothetical protein [Paenibacillus apii]